MASSIPSKRWSTSRALWAALLAIMGLHGPAAKGTEVILLPVDANAARGRLVSFDLEGGAKLQVADGREVVYAAADLIQITRPTPSAGRDQRQPHGVLFCNGDVLFGQILGGDADALEIESAAIGQTRLPLESIAVLARQSGPREQALRLPPDWRPPGEDRLLLDNGDVVIGFISGFRSDAVMLEDGSQQVPLRVIQRIEFANPPAPAKSGLMAMVRTVHGDRLSLEEFEARGENVRGVRSGGFSARLALNDIERVEVHGGRWERLSLHEPVSVEQTPMLSLAWPVVINRNVLGGALRVAGEEYEYGIGVHSRCRLTFELTGEYAAFVTSLGLDDDSGSYADVNARILVDGESRFHEDGIRPGRLVGPVRIELERARRLELIVDYGANGDLQDRFNWIDPGLVRRSSR